MMYKYFKFKANTTIFLVIVINAVFKIGSQPQFGLLQATQSMMIFNF